jgi:hypothetical protein
MMIGRKPDGSIEYTLDPDIKVLHDLDKANAEIARLTAEVERLKSDNTSMTKKENIMDGLLIKYFVLKPSGDDAYAKASRMAMERYALIIRKENPQLADDLVAWVLREEDANA